MAGWVRVNTVSDIDMTKDSFITTQKHYYINSQTEKEIVNENVTSPPTTNRLQRLNNVSRSEEEDNVFA